MQNILQFIQKYSLFLFFIVLQAVCFALLVSNNSFHRTTYINSSSSVAGFFYDMSNGVTDYFSLREANEELAKQNAVLSGQIPQNLRVLSDHSIIIEDTLYEQQYAYIPAKVINSSLYNRANYFTINEGTESGIEKDQGVIGPNGVVGFVKDVSAHYATIVPLIHFKFQTSVRLKTSQYHGILSWEKDDDEYTGTLTGIPSHVELAIGDSIVTREASGRFPENVMVGTIKSFERLSGQNYFLIKVDFATDFHKTYHVYCVSNIYRQELEELEERLEEEGGAND